MVIYRGDHRLTQGNAKGVAPVSSGHVFTLRTCARTHWACESLYPCGRAAHAPRSVQGMLHGPNPASSLTAACALVSFKSLCLSCGISIAALWRACTMHASMLIHLMDALARGMQVYVQCAVCCLLISSLGTPTCFHCCVTSFLDYVSQRLVTLRALLLLPRNCTACGGRSRGWCFLFLLCRTRP